MRTDKRISLIYESTMCFLALTAVILAIIDLTSSLTPTFQSIDTLILALFILDYLIRLLCSKHKKEFFKKNILDFIAIIPLSSMFKVFRIAKLTKVVRLTKFTKLTKVITYLLRLQTKCKRFLDTNGFKYMLLLSFIMVLIGAIGIHYAEKMPFENSIWWSFVTVTTVGYGDISPSTTLGRIIANILMMIGIGLIGSLTSTITSYFFNKNTSATSYKDDIINDIKEKLDDIDTIATVLKSIRST